jgi:hypothetical protein
MGIAKTMLHLAIWGYQSDAWCQVFKLCWTCVATVSKSEPLCKWAIRARVAYNITSFANHSMHMTFTRTYIHVCAKSCTHANSTAVVDTYLYNCTFVYVHSCIYMHAAIRTRMHRYIHAHSQAFMHVRIQLHIYVHAYSNTHIRTQVHAQIS